MLSLLLIAEGNCEAGKCAPNAPPGDHAVTPILVNKAASDLAASLQRAVSPFQFVATRKFTTLQLSTDEKRLFRDVRVPGNGLQAKFKSGLLLSRLLKLDGVVFALDRERRGGADLYGIMSETIQSMPEDKRPRVLVQAFACRSVETWLLADEIASRKIFGGKSFAFSGDPELRPAPESLKVWLNSASEDAGMTVPVACASLAAEVSFTRLGERCSTSVPPFLESVQASLLR